MKAAYERLFCLLEKKMNRITAQRWVRIAALNGFVAVLCGAWGAHGLETKLDERMLSVFKTAAYYQMVHSLLLLLLAILIHQKWLSAWLLNWSALFCMIGIILFSGSLYGLSLSGITALGVITPVGGLALLTSWGFLAYAAMVQR
jgi:uncharacterized membrane protein YgdD (TMEM256/DUF423 family)